MPTPASHYQPEDMRSITTQLFFNGNCAEAIEFYQKYFEATLTYPAMPGPDGKSILHALLNIGDAQIMLSDAWPGAWEKGPETHATGGLYIYVEDCDAMFNRAIEAGCEVVYPMMNAFWGDRSGRVKDPFGHCWGISTQKWKMTPEEVQQGQKEWMTSMGNQS